MQVLLGSKLGTVRFLAHCYSNVTSVENRVGESCDANSELVN